MNNVRTMDENLAQQRWFARVFGTMFSVFAGIAIVLAAVGLFAVTAYSVTQRTQEIGVTDGAWGRGEAGVVADSAPRTLHLASG